LVQLPVDLTLTIVVPVVTAFDVYPDIKSALLTPVSKGAVYVSISEYKLNGPASVPTVPVNVIIAENAIILFLINFKLK
jgi:hypothetical protein